MAAGDRFWYRSMSLKDLFKPQDDSDWTDEEKFEWRRRQYEALVAQMEENRANLEAAGRDVDAELAEIHAHWQSYAEAHWEVERRAEEYLQSTANLADAVDKMLQLVRDEMAAWQAALDQVPEGSLQRAAVWDGFTRWKEGARQRAEEALANHEGPTERYIYRETLRILKGG